MAFAGLRGAVGLALGLLVELDNDIRVKDRERISFLVRLWFVWMTGTHVCARVRCWDRLINRPPVLFFPALSFLPLNFLSLTPHRFPFKVAGIVLLTVFINGSLGAVVYRSLKMYKPNPYRQVLGGLRARRVGVLGTEGGDYNPQGRFSFWSVRVCR